jgi:ribokinase
VDTVIDTTGAGDAFVGSLCARLALGDDLGAAVTWASAAASLSVERPGTVESYATCDEVERRLAQAGASA